MPQPKQQISDKTTFIIVGAGPAGLFSARALNKLGVPGKNIKILEKESWAGGKCHTYVDPENESLVTEFGAALVATNYGVVLDAIHEKKIKYEEVLPTKPDSMDFMKQFHQENTLGKIKFSAEFLKELVVYETFIREYEHARDHQLPLPKDYLLPFAEFAQRKGLMELNDLLRPLVTGFGYGAMQVCPTYAVLEYMGHTTVPGMGLIPGLLNQGPFYAIKGGFQRLMEAIAEDYGVLTEVNIHSIDRSNGVEVSFSQHGKEQQLKADYLILALSPLHWPKLGLKLSETEKLCTGQLTHYRYPVAVCKLKGYPAHQEFFEPALQPEGFGKLALITTRDNRSNPEDGRLCTSYVNLPQGNNSYNLSPGTCEYEALKSELESLPAVTEVKLFETKIWEDYMSMLPWDLRCHLQSQQFSDSTRTGYTNSCLSFEDVACVANEATRLIANSFSLQPVKIFDNSLWTESYRIYGLLKAPKIKPVSTSKEEQKPEQILH
ncbi:MULTISPECIES: FAD-dependent oxidoreductase [unclassified Legionella]|uniref:FAD-dependent oxidoreductase n=1 Tax=unclassified Legionella TaxID=2622702 RepID=UPI00105611F6|nr:MULTISPECIES: FAD-dependent oxidoreductase [unclassified Legionella]MDI9818492.1 FAD-dependent oxidoreductase [Legionella sp. PL877]